MDTAKVLLLVLVAAVTNAECNVACKWSGYDGGVYVRRGKKEFCLCFEAKDYDWATKEKRTVIPIPQAAQALESSSF